MPQGLKINDGPVPWDSPAIKLYEKISDLITGGAGVVATALAKSNPIYFGVEIENTSGKDLPGPCPCVTTGPFETPNRKASMPPTAKFKAALMAGSLPGEWTVMVTATANPTVVVATGTIVGMPTVWYAPNGSTLAVRALGGTPATYKYLIVNPVDGQLTAWDSQVVSQSGGPIDGFSPDGRVFVSYKTAGTGAATVEVFDLTTMSPKTMGFTSIVGPMYSFALYFTPCSDWLARVPDAPWTELEVVSVAIGSTFGQLITPTYYGIDASVVVGGTGIQPLKVLMRGDLGVEITGPFDVMVNGTSVSSNTNPKVGKIDYRCVQPLPRVEVQIEPTSTCNNNQPSPPASAFFDIASGATKLVRCLQKWTVPTGTVPNTPAAHFCAIAEAFTPMLINGISVPKQTGPSFAGLVISEENIALQNMLITKASLARVIFTARNPLPFDAVATVVMKPVKSYAQRFKNWPRHAAEVKQAGLRPMGEDREAASELTLKMAAGSEQAIEAVVYVPEGTQVPSAAAFEVVQTILGVTVGGVVVIVTHEADDLVLVQNKPVALPLCPIALDGPARLSYSAADPSPGSAPGLYRGLSGQKVGAFFVAPLSAVSDVSVYAESTSHPALQIEGLKFDVGDTAANAPFFASWHVECNAVPSGRHAVLLVAQAPKFEPVRLLLEFDVFEGTPWKPERPWFEDRFGLRVGPMDLRRDTASGED